MTDFEKLFIENKDLVYRFLIKLSGNISLAEELTQETFFRAYVNLASLREREKAAVWLCQIAKNTYFSWYNEQKKIDFFESTDDMDSSALPEDVVILKELSREALIKLNELEEPYREVFILSVFGGLSLKEISEIFNKSESWARVTFYRAKHKLLERMK